MKLRAPARRRVEIRSARARGHRTSARATTCVGGYTGPKVKLGMIQLPSSRTSADPRGLEELIDGAEGFFAARPLAHGGNWRGSGAASRMWCWWISGCPASRNRGIRLLKDLYPKLVLVVLTVFDDDRHFQKLSARALPATC
jgi:hypothetical protein